MSVTSSDLDYLSADIPSPPLIIHSVIPHQFLQSRQLQYSVCHHSPLPQRPSAEKVNIISEVERCTSASAPFHNHDRVSAFSNVNISAPVEHAKKNQENLAQGLESLEDEQIPNIERPAIITQDINKGKERTNKLNICFDIRTVKPSANVTKNKDMNHLMKLDQSIAAGASESGPGSVITRSQRITDIVDNRKYVSVVCRRSLDKFRFRPRMINETPVVNTGGRNEHGIYPLGGDDIEAGDPTTGPGARTQRNNSNFAEEASLEAFAVMNYFPEEEENTRVGGDSNFTKYGLDNGRWSSTVLDIRQELAIGRGIGSDIRQYKAGTSQEKKSHPMMNSELVEIDCDDYGDIDDDEMMMAVYGFEGYSAWEEDITVSSVCDVWSDSADELPSVKNIGQDHLNQGQKLLSSPHLAPQKLILCEKLIQPIQGHQQFFSSTPNMETQMLNFCPSSETLIDAKLRDSLPATMENFSPPSSVEFALNNYSQEQEIFDCNLQGSLPQEDSMGIEGNSAKVTLTRAHQIEMGFDLLKVPDKIQEWLPDPKETPYISEEGAGEEGEGEGEKKNLMVELKKKKPKVTAKKRAAGMGCDKEPLKRRKIRICDPSQFKISDYTMANSPLPYSAVSFNERYDRDGKMKPFVRPQFLPVVSEKPTVVGLGARLSVKTCFRVGEALRMGWMSASGHLTGDALVELYARVGFSERVDLRQNFQFMDIFHDKPPFLNGLYELAKACEIWDKRSEVFLGDAGKGKMARAIGRMKKRNRGDGTPSFVIQISGIRETNWEDVDWLRGIICGRT